ncbi:MAG: hypothetical protein HC876_18780 [Chloroflexaceae bacterium]|nr:hypothetical protein [Chloroflexaceae bacterium]
MNARSPQCSGRDGKAPLGAPAAAQDGRFWTGAPAPAPVVALMPAGTVAYASGLPLGMKLHTTLSMDEVAWLVRPSLPDLPPTPCPNCQHPTPLTKWSCACCGLLFPSRVPAAVQELSGYRVLRPLGAAG